VISHRSKVGKSVGDTVGVADGATLIVGLELPSTDGLSEGTKVGLKVGRPEGSSVGKAEGLEDGSAVGSSVGASDGEDEMAAEGPLDGTVLGESEITPPESMKVPSTVGTSLLTFEKDGARLGAEETDGDIDGAAVILPTPRS
jgi:hypothetical protein